jgi:hypothetical protein
MRLPRLRFSVRSLMVAVLVVAVSIESVRLARRSSEYGEKARLHASLARTYSVAPSTLNLGSNLTQADRDELFEEIRRVRDYHARIEEKYAHLARRPWLSAEPDPPEPGCRIIISSCPI